MDNVHGFGNNVILQLRGTIISTLESDRQQETDVEL